MTDIPIAGDNKELAAALGDFLRAEKSLAPYF